METQGEVQDTKASDWPAEPTPQMWEWIIDTLREIGREAIFNREALKAQEQAQDKQP